MPKNFYAYLSDTEKEYVYRIRTVVPISKEDIKVLEKVLSKYEVVSISSPRETSLQSAPVDFPSFSMVRVTIIDFITRIPVSNYYVQEEIRKAFGLNNYEINVRGKNDPVEIQEILKDAETLEDSIDSPLLSTNPEYKEYNYDVDSGKQYYGDDYNKSLLSYIAAKEKEKVDGISDLQPENQDKKLFSWLGQKTEGSEWNKDYDTVKPVSKNDIKGNPPEPAEVSPYGNFDSSLRLKEFKRTSKGDK